MVPEQSKTAYERDRNSPIITIIITHISPFKSSHPSEQRSANRKTESDKGSRGPMSRTIAGHRTFPRYPHIHT
jgi:hypothetical protein